MGVVYKALHLYTKEIYLGEQEEVMNIRNTPFTRWIYGKVMRLHENAQRKILQTIPKYELEDKHCTGASVLANRKSLLKLLPKDGVVAEIGADRGDFSDLILNITNPQKFHIIDIWNSAQYDDSLRQYVEQRFSEVIASGKVEINHALSIDAADEFSDNYFDWIYIDTDHSYQTTIKELYAYANKVKRNGYIAGHDYSMGNWEKSFKYGVIEAVAEFCIKENWKIAYLTANHVESNSFAITRI